MAKKNTKKTTKTKAPLRLEAELEAMRIVAVALSHLSKDKQERVLRYVGTFFDVWERDC